MRQQRIYGGGYARYGLGGLGFIAFEILDKHGQGIAYTIGQTDIGHIIMSHKLPLFVDIAGTRLVGNGNPLFLQQRRRNPVSARHALPQRVHDEALFPATDKAVGKQTVHQHCRTERRSVIGVHPAVVCRHLLFRVGYPETRAGNDGGNKAVRPGNANQPSEHKVARIVVALRQGISQQFPDRQRELRLRVLFQHRTPRIGVKFRPAYGHQRVKGNPLAVKIVAHGQRLMYLKHAHHRVNALVVDSNRVGIVNDYRHPYLSRIFRHNAGYGIGKQPGI